MNFSQRVIVRRFLGDAMKNDPQHVKELLSIAHLRADITQTPTREEKAFEIRKARQVKWALRSAYYMGAEIVRS